MDKTYARVEDTNERIAETLQRSLLPVLPEIPSVQAAARYRASETGASVGGDFYELIPLRSSAVGIAIGDVVGHDIFAAAAMGHLRGLLRACAWDDSRESSPAGVLQRVDQLMNGLGMSTMATACYLRAVKQTNNTWQLEYSNAGHPPVIVRLPNRGIKVLDQARGMLLGVQTEARTWISDTVPAGSCIVAFTDGLIESANTILPAELKRLADTIQQGPEDPEQLCDHILESFHIASNDDVALLAVNLQR